MLKTATKEKPVVTLKGKSGKSYQFTVYDWGTSFKPVGAVYSVLKVTDGQYSLIYVGQTSDLSERFDSHHKQSCFDRNRKTHIGILVESSESMRFKIETDLINNYSTPCNG